jgi:hypothetical protein
MDTLNIVYIIIFSAFFLYGIYQIAFDANYQEPPSTGDKNDRPPIGGGGEDEDPEEGREDPPQQEPVEGPIDEFPVQALDLPTRAQNALLNAGIKTFADLNEYEDYTDIPGVGERYAEEIGRAIVRVKTD